MRSKALVIVSLLLAAAPNAAATTSTKLLSVPELARRSDLIMRGLVQDIWSSTEGGRFYTNAAVVPVEVWKGTAPVGRIIVKTLGGSDGRYRTQVLGSPTLTAGEETVLFLVSQRAGTYGITRLAEGTFRVLHRAAVAPRVERDLSGIAFRTPSQGSGVPITLMALRVAVLLATQEGDPDSGSVLLNLKE